MDLRKALTRVLVAPRVVRALEKLRATAGFIRIVRNWPDHYAATYGLTHRPQLRYRLRTGLRLVARPRTLDVAVIKDVFLHNVYCPPGFEIRTGDVVVDVGAHIGAFAALAARAAPGVAVFALEPAPDNFALLSKNTQINELSNVRLLNHALSGRKGARDLHLSENTAGHSLLRAEAGPGSGCISVPSVSLADVMATHRLGTIDLLKMDCEGAEYEILEAAMSESLCRVRRVVMEAHTLDSSRSPAAIVDLLEGQGFVVRSASKDDGTAMIWATRE